ncbi:PREDICTED: uncharacterized protein LOC105312516 isoform X1 [Amphimedon queenslandica]|uniref:Cation-dependent mannose-6-phosphate receptor n=1 Tax=Amphimedon queenslandica TaxID=400682 RepID=A0A1X7V0U7_AMPQE|nr:PREDICTED: uncharacterized protein LOC105312516 isoform X1 [Amphimedon queenslandica]|eukprot:XP_011403530.2 PREDICTED: uncharacterized protein LOC105312516 isoform X1 [Amphimedon queenslandica]
MMYALTSFLILCISGAVYGTTSCEVIGSCKASCSGNVIDLSIILGNSLPLQVIDLADGNKSKESLFFLAPCQGYHCGMESAEAAICQEISNDFISCGLLNETSWRFETLFPYRFTVTFTGGDGRRMSTIKFEENLSLNSLNSSYLDEYPDNHYNFKVTGPCIRPGSCTSSSNYAGMIGFIIITLFLIVVVLYLGIGSIVMYCRGARRIELIPHISFWRQFPQLVKEGCLYATGPCCCWEKTDYNELPDVKIVNVAL